MKHYCKNHPDKAALSLCHSCGEYFCSDCLNEGHEYYYCNKDDCFSVFNKELLKKRKTKVKIVALSKESVFIKRIAKIFILLSSIALIDLTLKIVNSLPFALDLLAISPSVLKVNIVGFYVVKYLWLVNIIAWLLVGILLIASWKIYYLKNRKIFLFALSSQVLSIVLYNIVFYSYLELMRNTNILELGYEGYTNFWSLDKFSIAFLSLLFIIVIIYLIIKFSSENIIREFLKSNA
jgi:hypothetical protein